MPQFLLYGALFEFISILATISFATEPASVTTTTNTKTHVIIIPIVLLSRFFRIIEAISCIFSAYS